MAYLEFLLKWGQYFLLCFVIGFPLHELVCRLIHSRKWWGDVGKALFVPGAIIHELGHAVACLVTGKRITGTNFGTRAQGGHVNFLMTGPSTPLVLHAVAYAPVISCGIVTALIQNYIALNEMNFEIVDSIIWVFLLISVASGAAPSTTDMKLAFHSLRERPRVTTVEVISLIWPVFLPDLLGVASDLALLTYLIAMISTYIILWKLMVSPCPHGTRRAKGIPQGLPGDGRDSRGERWPSFRQWLQVPELPNETRPSRGFEVRLHVATAEDVYRAAGLKVKNKRAKSNLEVLVDA